MVDVIVMSTPDTHSSIGSSSSLWLPDHMPLYRQISNSSSPQQERLQQQNGTTTSSSPSLHLLAVGGTRGRINKSHTRLPSFSVHLTSNTYDLHQKIINKLAAKKSSAAGADEPVSLFAILANQPVMTTSIVPMTTATTLVSATHPTADDHSAVSSPQTPQRALLTSPSSPLVLPIQSVLLPVAMPVLPSTASTSSSSSSSTTMSGHIDYANVLLRLGQQFVDILYALTLIVPGALLTYKLIFRPFTDTRSQPLSLITQHLPQQQTVLQRITRILTALRWFVPFIVWNIVSTYRKVRRTKQVALATCISPNTSTLVVEQTAMTRTASTSPMLSPAESSIFTSLSPPPPSRDHHSTSPYLLTPPSTPSLLNVSHASPSCVSRSSEILAQIRMRQTTKQARKLSFIDYDTEEKEHERSSHDDTNSITNDTSLSNTVITPTIL